jgi:Uma2 family endonuclease
MDPERPGPRYLLAPGAAGPAMRLPGARQDEPRLDDHLVRGETREEIVRGRRVIASPAKPPHARRHTELGYLVRAHVIPGYVTATDLLTRVGSASDFATDTCVYREGVDPATETRYLEELAFEVVSEQSLKDITERAEDLSNRGVRRLIAIFVKKGEVAEWSAETKSWIPLPLDAALHDSTLARPMLIRALFDAAVADNEVVDALAAKANPRLAQREANARAEGRAEGLIQGILALCKTFDIPLGSTERSQLHALDPAALEELLIRISTERCLPKP